MILKLIDDYINERVLILNERLDSEIKALQTDFITEFERIPANQSNNYYQINIDGLNASDEYEANIMYSVTARIEFSFFVGAKKFSGYQEIFNRYLWDFVRVLVKYNTSYSDTDITTSSVIQEVNSISLTNGSRIENNYFKPTIEMNINIIDDTINSVLTTEAVND